MSICTAVQFYPFPPIKQSALFNISVSPADGRLITQQGLDNLELSHSPDPNNSGLNVTVVTLNHFNRSAPTSRTAYQVILNGNWSYVGSP
jgi:hypothetical protein